MTENLEYGPKETNILSLVALKIFKLAQLQQQAWSRGSACTQLDCGQEYFAFH